MSKRVKLTEAELLQVYIVAAQRLAQNMALGRKRTYSPGINSLDDHVLGCLGEIALAKYLNRFWTGNLGDIRAKDVGTLQVRATRRANGCLLLHHEDSDDDRFFLAIVAEPFVDLMGCMFARDGKQKEYWREVDKERGIFAAAYFVPAGKLDDMPERKAPSAPAPEVTRAAAAGLTIVR